MCETPGCCRSCSRSNCSQLPCLRRTPSKARNRVQSASLASSFCKCGAVRRRPLSSELPRRHSLAALDLSPSPRHWRKRHLPAEPCPLCLRLQASFAIGHQQPPRPAARNPQPSPAPAHPERPDKLTWYSAAANPKVAESAQPVGAQPVGGIRRLQLNVNNSLENVLNIVL